MSCKLSIILPVYNCEAYLRESIDSILNQSYSDFELLIINDGSTDHSLDLINSYNDSRIVVFDQVNQGLAATLNRGLALASGEYVARMDQDDISHPERLAIQVAFLDQNPEVAVCGTWAKLINEQSEQIGKATYPLSHEQIKAFLLFNSPLCHPSVMFRKSVLVANDIHYNLVKTEDFDFWIRLVKLTKFANIPKFLIKYRLGVGFTAKLHKNACDRCFESLVSTQALKLVPTASDEELRVHYLIADFHCRPNQGELELIFVWLSKLVEANLDQQLYDQAALHFVVAKQWLNVCARLQLKSIFQPRLWSHSLVMFFRLGNMDKIALLRLILKL